MRRTGVTGLLAAAVVASPVVVGAVYALAGVNADRIVRVVSESTVWHAVVWTILTAAVATALSAVAAITIATAVRGDRVAGFFAVAPLPIPHIVAAILGVMILGQSGLIARLLYAAGAISKPSDMPALILDPLGIGFMLTLTWKEIPYLTCVAMSILAKRGATLDDVARSLGASPRQTLWRITVPVLWRGLAPAAVATFIFVAGSFEAAYLLGPSRPQPLPLLLYERYAALDLTRRADAYVLVLLSMVLGLVAVVVLESVRARWSSE